MTSMRTRMSHGLSRDRVALEVRRARGPFAILLALALVAAGAVTYIVGSLRTHLPWQQPYTVRVAVEDAKGVVAGKQEVRIAGVAVGRITRVALEHGRAVLTLTIDRDYAPLYRDARVALRPKTPLDDLYLDVERRGSAAAGRLTGVLAAGRVRTPVDIGRVLDTFDPDTRARVKTAIDAFGRGLDDRGAQLRAAFVELSPFLRSLQRLTAELAARGRYTRRLVHNLRLLTGELGARQRQLSDLVGGGARTLGTLADADTPLGRTIRELPPTLTQLRRSFATLRATADELDPAFAALQPVAAALPPGLQALRRLGADAQPALRALRAPLPRLTRLVRVLAPTVADLDGALRALRPQAPRLDRLTKQVVPCEAAVAKFFHNTLSVTKFSHGRVPFPRGHLVAGVGIAGGAVPEATQRPGRSCAQGGPRK